MTHKFRLTTAFVVVLIFGLVGTNELIRPGYFESHDGIIHVMRLAHFDSALKDGQFQVRWLPTWMAGYGSPIFNFNWSLPYYIGSLLHYFGISYEESIKMVFLLGYVLSGLFMFLLLYELARDKVISVLGSVIYMWAPYRFLDIYIRGALGEATAFVFFPLILLVALRIYRTNSTSFGLLSGFIWSTFILTHNIMSLVGVFIYCVFVFALFLKKRTYVFLTKSLIPLGVGVSLTAFFWVPAIWEKKYDEISNLTTLYDYTQQFPSLSSLINSPWQYAYAVPKDQQSSMSFQLGLGHWILLLVVFLTVAYALLFNRIKGMNLFVLGFSIMLFSVSIFMTLGILDFIYKIPIVSSSFNFPWRFLSLTVFALSLMVVVFTILPRLIKFAIVAFFLVLVVYLYFPFSKVVSWRYSNSDEGYKSMIKTNINYLPDTEYLPKGASYIRLLDEVGPAINRPFFHGDNIAVTDYKRNNLTHTAIISSSGNTQVGSNTFYFPGWELSIDGRREAVSVDTFGLVKFTVPTGTHKIALRFGSTGVRSIANTVSLLSFVGFGLLLFLKVAKVKIS